MSWQISYILDKMVRYDYRQRYQTATEALQALVPLSDAYSSSTTTSASQRPFTASADTFGATVTYPQSAQGSSSPSDRIDEVKSTQSPLPLQAIPDFSEELVGNQTRQPWASKRWNQRSRLIAIGAGIATALALSVGFHHIQTSIAWNNSAKISLANTLTGHSQRVSAIAVTPDGQLIASGSDDKTIKLWNLRTGQLLRTLSGHSEGIRSVAISPDGKLLASGSDDKTIKLWNLDTGKLLRTLTGHSDIVQSVTISPDGKLIASGSNDKTVKLWNLLTGQEVRTLTGFSSIVYSVAISPDGQTLVSGSKKLYLWHLPTGNLIRTISDPSGNAVASLVITPDGETLVSGSNWGKLSLWNLRNLLNGCQGGQPCRPTHILSGYSGWVHALAISPDGKILATGSDRENTIKLWNTGTGKPRISISSRLNSVESLAFTPDGKSLVTNGEDGKIELWRSR